MDDVTTKQAAVILGVKPRRVQILIKKGKFKTARLCECGCGYMIAREEVLKRKRELGK